MFASSTSSISSQSSNCNCDNTNSIHSRKVEAPLLEDLILPAEAHVYDVLIIGAGPAALGVAARLNEPMPSALFTDLEHTRRHQWFANYNPVAISKVVNIKGTTSNGRTSRRKPFQIDKLDIGVIDMLGDKWMQGWDANFKALEIQHLRSPMFFHPDPYDIQGLRAFAHENGRVKELREITGIVGQELTKHQKKKVKEKKCTNSHNRQYRENVNIRDENDFYTPSTSLFRDHMESVIKRYKLQDAIRQGRCTSIKYGYLEGGDMSEPACQGFMIATEDGKKYGAKIVVVAVGPGGKPKLPSTPEEIIGSVHTAQIPKMGLLPDYLRQRIEAPGHKTTSIGIVGGGLTSAQIADSAIKKGVSHVHLFMRGYRKVKPFDVDNTWIGTWKNQQQMMFEQCDTMEERLHMIKEARNGGSITPIFNEIMKKHERAGRLTIHTQTILISQTFDMEVKQWKVELGVGGQDSIMKMKLDFIVNATGVVPNIADLPLFNDVRKSHPIEVAGGFPCLKDDLSWRDDIPLFVVGRLASLRLGPGAGNLIGARLGAERVALGVETVKSTVQVGVKYEEDANRESTLRDNYASGIGNAFAGLKDEGYSSEDANE